MVCRFFFFQPRSWSQIELGKLCKWYSVESSGYITPGHTNDSVYWLPTTGLDVDHDWRIHGMHFSLDGGSTFTNPTSATSIFNVEVPVFEARHNLHRQSKTGRQPCYARVSRIPTKGPTFKPHVLIITAI